MKATGNYETEADLHIGGLICSCLLHVGFNCFDWVNIDKLSYPTVRLNSAHTLCTAGHLVVFCWTWVGE